MSFALALLAGEASAANLRISGAWIRALPARLPAAGYFEMANTSKKDIALVGAQSPLCGMLMLHRSSEQGGMGRMEEVDRVSVPAGGKVAFAPGGLHLMCMDPKPGLKPGAAAPVTLHFSDGTSQTATFAIRNAMGH